MNRVLRPLGILATVALVGYAAVLLLADPNADEAVEAAIADARDGEGEQEELERSRERLRRTARGLAMSPEGPPGELEEADDAPVPYGSGEVDGSTARAGFSRAMKKVDALGESRRRLSQEEWDEVYRQANDAFAALSMVLDATDPGQAAELEAAHLRLKQGLRKVRVRGRKLAH